MREEGRKKDMNNYEKMFFNKASVDDLQKPNRAKPPLPSDRDFKYNTENIQM